MLDATNFYEVRYQSFDSLSMTTMGKLQRRNIKEMVSNMATILVV